MYYFSTSCLNTLRSMVRTLRYEDEASLAQVLALNETFLHFGSGVLFWAQRHPKLCVQF